MQHNGMRKMNLLGRMLPAVGAMLTCTAIGQTVWINEIHYDNAGGDQDEGIEIAGSAGTVLDGYDLVGYNGGDSLEYRTVPLSGVIDDEGAGYGAVWFGVPVNGLQNGPLDGVALVDDTHTVLQFLSYEGILTALDGPAAGLASDDMGVSEETDTPVGESLQLAGTGSNYVDFTWVGPFTHSRGSLNDGQFMTGGTPVSNMPPAIAVSPPDTSPVILVSNELSFTVTAIEVPADAAQTIDMPQPADLPAGATFAAANGVSPLTSTFTWTPEAAGDYPITFTASDQDGTATQKVTITVVPPPGGTTDFWINELHYDNDGGDTDEGIEIAGLAGINLDGMELVAYNGDGGVNYGVIPLTGIIDDEGVGYGALWFEFPGLQNGAPDGIALVDDSDSVLQFLSYEGVFAGTTGPAAGVDSTDMGVEEEPAPRPGMSLQLAGVGAAYDDFAWEGPVPHSRGDLNEGQTLIGGAVTDLPPHIYLNPNDDHPEIPVDEAYAITLTAIEPDRDIVTLTYSNMPAGATLTPGTNVGVGTVESRFDWTPTSAGTYAATFTAWDDVNGEGAPATVTFTVYEPEGVVTGLEAYVNEVRANDESTDDAEFVEIVAPAGFNLKDCALRHYNGDEDGDNPDGVWGFTFPNFVVPADDCTDTNGVELGFVVIAQNTGLVPNADFTLPGLLQNGPDGLILYDSEGNILDAMAWEAAGDLPIDDPGTVTTGGDTEADNYLPVTVDDDAGDNSLCAPDNVRGATGGEWAVMAPTPGAPNGNQTCGELSVTTRGRPKPVTGGALFVR